MQEKENKMGGFQGDKKVNSVIMLYTRELCVRFLICNNEDALTIFFCTRAFTFRDIFR